MQRRLAAILHADAADYSRLMAGDEWETLASLKSRLVVLKDAVAAHAGRICNTAGDAVLAEFPSVSAAVSSAIEAQRRIDRLNDEVPDERRLRIRIGINLGEVIAEDDGQVYGTGVNVAARLQALAKPGHITLSGRAREQVDSALTIGFSSLGQFRVKNIPEPVHVFQVTTDEAGPPPRWTSRDRRRLAYWITAAAFGSALAVAVALVDPWTRFQPSTPPIVDASSRVGTATAHIAVLPFHNASGDPEQDYFAAAITEDLTGALSRFAAIGVIASEAVAGFERSQATPADIRRELNVSYLVSGSVQRDGDIVRLLVRLIDTGSGLQLWSQRYHRPIGELFQVQDEIVRTVAGEAAVTLGRIEDERVFGKAIPDLEAYDLYIRGRALIARETRDDNIEARQLFRRAIEKAPRYALAHVGLAWTFYREATRGWSQFMSRNAAEAERLVRRASQLDPSLSEAYELLGWLMLLRGEYEQSRESLTRARALNPNSFGTLQALGQTLTFLGDADGAIKTMEKAVSLGASPSARSVPILGMAYVLRGDSSAAVRFLETFAGERRDHFYYATLSIAYAELGDGKAAVAAAKQTRHAWPFFKAEEFARQFRKPSDQQRILDDLRKAGLG